MRRGGAGMQRGRIRKTAITSAALLALLSGCSAIDSLGGGGGGFFGGGNRAVEKPIEEFTAEQIFKRGEFELAQGNPDDAAEFFAEVERLYPYSSWAKRAIIMQAFPTIKTRHTPKPALPRNGFWIFTR